MEEELAARRLFELLAQPQRSESTSRTPHLENAGMGINNLGREFLDGRAPRPAPKRSFVSRA
jgi:hypothetical protein